MSSQENTAKAYMAELFNDPVAKAFNWEGAGLDIFLQSLVTTVNKTPINIAVTLHVNGGVVTGTLISRDAYFSEVSDLMAASWPGEGGEDIREAFSLWMRDEESVSEEDELPAQFVHLKNAKIVSGDLVLPTGPGVLWRGKIGSVSGFFLGVLS